MFELNKNTKHLLLATTIFLLILSVGEGTSLAAESEWIVKINGDLPAQPRQRSFKTPFGEFMVLRTNTSPQKTQAWIRELEQNPAVEYIEPNRRYALIRPVPDTQPFWITPSMTLNLTPGEYRPLDPLFASQWNYENTGTNYSNPFTAVVKGSDIDIMGAWQLTRGSRDLIVAIVDTGADYKNPELQPNLWINPLEHNGRPGVDDDGNGYIDDIHGYNFAYNNGNPMDDQGHGTHCAGIIGAAHDAVGIAGIMAHTSIMPLKFLNKQGEGSTDQAIQAIAYAVANGAKIISNSWGGGEYSRALEEAIRYAREKEVAFVAAAGNSGENNDLLPLYPASYSLDNVIAVAAHGADDLLTNYSNYGPNTVTIAAPGKNITSTVLLGGYQKLSGTSMAAPHVAGAIGLLLASNPGLDVIAIKQRLRNTAKPVTSFSKKTSAGGRLSVTNLLTDTRPPRDLIPDESWHDYPLLNTIETPHPYPGYTNFKQTLKIPGATHIRAIISRYDIMPILDALEIRQSSKVLVDRISGDSQNYVTHYVDGDEITFYFHAGASFKNWGFVISNLQYTR